MRAGCMPDLWRATGPCLHARLMPFNARPADVADRAQACVAVGPPAHTPAHTPPTHTTHTRTCHIQPLHHRPVSLSQPMIASRMYASRLPAACSAKAVRELRGHAGDVLCHQQAGTLLASGSVDRTVRLWDLRCGLGCGQHRVPLDSFPYSLQVRRPCRPRWQPCRRGTARRVCTPGCVRQPVPCAGPGTLVAAQRTGAPAAPPLRAPAAVCNLLLPAAVPQCRRSCP